MQINITLVVETLKGNNIAQEGIYSLYNSIADNFKEYDLDTEYCLNIYKYFVCTESVFKH
jgi:hypothetical protein